MRLVVAETMELDGTGNVTRACAHCSRHDIDA
jgi:hypothetical protein